MVLLKLKELKVKLQWTKRNINKKISERDEEAAKAANSHDFIVSLPQGLRHTCWGARRFVKWRTERIAIARALLKNAPILILDKDWTPSNSSGPFVRDCILLAACEAHESLPQSVEFPADVFTSCLTTPIKLALRW